MLEGIRLNNFYLAFIPYLRKFAAVVVQIEKDEDAARPDTSDGRKDLRSFALSTPLYVGAASPHLLPTVRYGPLCLVFSASVLSALNGQRF